MKLSYEDVTPYLYIKDQIEGRKANPVIRYLFIDEAQDYSPFQLAFLKELFPHARMTLLGDLNQAIYAHAYERTEPFFQANCTKRKKQKR